MRPALEVSDVQAILTTVAYLPLYQATAEPKHREKHQFTSPNQSQNWSFKKRRKNSVSSTSASPSSNGKDDATEALLLLAGEQSRTDRSPEARARDPTGRRRSTPKQARTAARRTGRGARPSKRRVMPQ
jgi:hypothetical protein